MSVKRHNHHPLVGLFRLLAVEIDKYRETESEKVGHDIGSQRAWEEWMRLIFPEWKRACWQDAVEEASRN